MSIKSGITEEVEIGREIIAGKDRNAALLVSNLYAAIEQIDETNSAAFLDDVKKTRKLLEIAKVAYERMCEFAIAEARAYIEISKTLRDGRWDDDIRGRDEKIILWLRNMSEQELSDIVAYAGNGNPIGEQYSLYLREEKIGDQKRQAIDYMDTCVQKFISNGMVEISVNDCLDHMIGHNTSTKRRIADNTVNRLRTMLINRGGACTGDGRYLNVLSESFNENARNAIAIRIKSIINDVRNLYEISSHIDHLPEFNSSDFIVGLGNDQFTSEVLSMLAKCGVIDIAKHAKVA